MQRLVNFTFLAGTLVGAATGAVFTPFGIPFGAFAGAVLGLLSGLWTVAVIKHEGSGFTLDTARLKLTAPPLVLLVAADCIAGAWTGLDGAFFIVVSFVVAAPLSATVTLLSAPWVVTLVRPEPADMFARPAMVRAVLIPVWFLLLAVVAWLVTFGFLTMR